MVQNLRPVGATAGSQETIRNTDLNDGKSVSSDNWVPIFEAQSSKTIHYAPGYGVPNREGNAGFGDLDLQGIDGAGAVVALDGELRWEVYRDANQNDPVGFGDTHRTEKLRADVAESKTDKTMMPLQKPGAGEDGYIVLAYKADPANDGHDLSASDSAVDQGVPYSRFNR